ncbi:MAG TPA: hypothetical protein VGL72_18435 [Bryobacteraceae bacterium]
MEISRRQIIYSTVLAAGGGACAEAAGSTVGLSVLRDAARLNGARLHDDRLRVIQPVIEQRQPRLQRLRDFDVSDAVGPTQGILVR